MTVARGPWDVTLAIAAVALALPLMLGNRTPDVMMEWRPCLGLPDHLCRHSVVRSREDSLKGAKWDPKSAFQGALQGVRVPLIRAETIGNVGLAPLWSGRAQIPSPPRSRALAVRQRDSEEGSALTIAEDG